MTLSLFIMLLGEGFVLGCWLSDWISERRHREAWERWHRDFRETWDEIIEMERQRGW